MFKDALHEQLGSWALAYIPWDGADHGEVARIAAVVGDGGDDAFHDAWNDAAERLMDEGRAALARGHAGSARACFLRAAGFYAKSVHPLFGEPVDPRLPAAARRQMAAFAQGMALGDAPALALLIPFDPVPLPAWFVPAHGHAHARRPLLVFVNGYDGSITDLYFGSAVAAARRGYHSLIFDGPGQGSLLALHDVRLRPDWETVVAAVLDVVLELPQVDPTRVALSGWSLGGYLAPRAACCEPRLAACIADPGRLDVAGGYRQIAIRCGATQEQARDLGTLPQGVIDRMEDAMRQDRIRRWSVMGRGYWVNGVSGLRAYLADLERYTLREHVGNLRCPTLVTRAEEDPIADDAEAFFDALVCRKTLLRFAAADGAGGHCEMGNRSLLNRRVLDWLDETLA